MRWNISILTLLLFINPFQREFWYNSNISCTSSAAAGARLSSDTEQQWENARREKAAQSRFLSMNERSWYVAQLNVWDGCGIQWNWIGHTHPTRIKNVHKSYHCPRADYKEADGGRISNLHQIYLEALYKQRHAKVIRIRNHISVGFPDLKVSLSNSRFPL